jgi:phosphoribosylformylglycinamidine synthase subunit PurL
LIDSLDRRPPGAVLSDGAAVFALGAIPRSLSGSRWAWERDHRAGTPPALDLDAHFALIGLVRALVADAMVVGVHDGADGLGVALAEMAVRAEVGFDIELDHPASVFAESPSVVLACVDTRRTNEVVRAAQSAGVPVATLGRAGGDRLTVRGILDVSLDVAMSAWTDRLPDALGHGATH